MTQSFVIRLTTTICLGFCLFNATNKRMFINGLWPWLLCTILHFLIYLALVTITAMMLYCWCLCGLFGLHFNFLEMPPLAWTIRYSNPKGEKKKSDLYKSKRSECMAARNKERGENGIEIERQKMRHFELDLMFR